MSSSLIPFEERELKSLNDKKSIAKSAASFIEEGDIIYIDSGTTTMHIIDYLKDCKNVTVLTNNLNAINRAIPINELNVISLPGTLERKTISLVSSDTVRTLEKYNIKKAFMAASGISNNGSIMNSSPLEYDIKKAAIASSGKVFLLIDSSKYGRSALLTYARLADIDKIIIDQNISNELLDICAREGVEVITASPVEEI